MQARTDFGLRAAVIVSFAASMLGGGCCGASAYTGGAALDVSSYPPDIQHAYVVFAANCSKCHGLSRPLNARIDNLVHWDLYIARMMRMPGSGISAREAPTILTFLYYYTGEIKGVDGRGQGTSGGDGSAATVPSPPDDRAPSEFAPEREKER